MAGRPPARRSDRGSRDGGYRDDYRDAGYRDGDYRAGGYWAGDDGDAGYRAGDDWDPGYRAGDDWDPGYRAGDDWDPGYRAGGDWDPGYRAGGDWDPGYRDGGHRGGGHRGGGSREDGSPGGGYRNREGRGYRDRGSGYQDRGDWAGESRTRWSGRDRRAWDDDDWAGEDGDSAEYEARDDSTGGAEGNERLTALTGSLLLVLFAAEGITILSVHQLLTLHFFLGMLLIGPVALKACAVLYRFVRYYTGAPEYRRKGPPAPLLRLLGPVVMITSLTVLGTGVMLAIVGPSGAGTWLFLHRASFILWFGAMTVHVLAYVWRLPRLISGDLATRAGYRAQEILAGRGARWLLLTASVVTGLLLAVLTYNRAGIWFGVGH